MEDVFQQMEASTMNILETVQVQCPYCGEIMELQIERAEGDQELIEDCPVCCKPVTVLVTCSDNGIISAEARPEDD